MKSIMELLEQENTIVKNINRFDNDFEWDKQRAIRNKKWAEKAASEEYIAEYDDFCEELGYKTPVNCGAKFHSKLYVEHYYEDEKIANAILAPNGKENALNNLYADLRAIRAEIKKALNF